MDPGMWYDDDALMDGLTEAVARERSVPEHVMQAAKDTFDWRGVDVELQLLTLSFDSLLTDPVGVRGPGANSTRMLAFDGEDLTIEIEVGRDVLMGQVLPARSQRVILQCADGRVDEVTADAAGFFQLRRPTQGPIRLKWLSGEAAGVVTGWISI